MSELLEIENLTVHLAVSEGTVEAVRGVSLTLREGEILAIVGESGCGKSMLCRSIMRLLPGNAQIVGGSIRAAGTDITACTEGEMTRLRGSLLSIVLQNPMSAFNPVVTVGAQIAEAVRIHNPGMRRQAVHSRSIELMELVGITHAGERFRLYPGQLSGGMLQRCAIAMALAGDPQILLADEPTTALDVTVQAQILELLSVVRQRRRTAVILVSHDLGVVARVADRVAVMYAGKIVEIGMAEEIFYDSRHPYTWGLLRALPAYAKGKGRLQAIPGMPPTLIGPPPGDAFACRNQFALAIDYQMAPPMFQISDTHFAASWLLDRRAPKIRRPFGGECHD